MVSRHPLLLKPRIDLVEWIDDLVEWIDAHSPLRWRVERGPPRSLPPVSSACGDRLAAITNGCTHAAHGRRNELATGRGPVLGARSRNQRPDMMRLSLLSQIVSLVHRAAGNPKKAEIYKGLVAALHEAVPATIPSNELRQLVDSTRGHMRQLTHTEPWLFQDVVSPLLANGRVTVDDACDVWIQELAALLNPPTKHEPRLFNRAREGQRTNVAAFLFAYSSRERRHASLKSMQAILKWQRRIVQQPLASTSDWTRWNGALLISMWILTFTRWGQYYLRRRGEIDRELEELSRDTRKLAMVKPMGEWRSEGDGNQRELASFLDQVEELLASSDKSKASFDS